MFSTIRESLPSLPQIRDRFYNYASGKFDYHGPAILVASGTGLLALRVATAIHGAWMTLLSALALTGAGLGGFWILRNVAIRNSGMEESKQQCFLQHHKSELEWVSQRLAFMISTFGTDVEVVPDKAATPQPQPLLDDERQKLPPRTPTARLLFSRNTPGTPDVEAGIVNSDLRDINGLYLRIRKQFSTLEKIMQAQKGSFDDLSSSYAQCYRQLEELIALQDQIEDLQAGSNAPEFEALRTLLATAQERKQNISMLQTSLARSLPGSRNRSLSTSPIAFSSAKSSRSTLVNRSRLGGISPIESGA